MRPISPSMNCHHQANTAYDKLAVISENMPKLLEIEQFIFELKQWLRAYIDALRNALDEEHFAKLTENNIFTGINTFADVYLNNGNIYWKDEYNNDIAWIKYDKEHQILTLHVKDSELSLSPNLAITVPTNADVDNSIVTYAFLHGLLQELENRVTITVDNTVIDGSNNPPSGNAVYDFVMANQLVLDDTVTQNSSNGVKSSGIYAVLQELDTNLRTLISALDDRISALESSSGSSSSSSRTWGVTKFNEVINAIGQPTMSVGQTVSEGKIVKIYALTHWGQRGPSDWGALSYTDWYYIWKDDNYTLTNADKSQINSRPSQSDYGSTPSSYPHVTLSYNSGNI